MMDRSESRKNERSERRKDGGNVQNRTLQMRTIGVTEFFVSMFSTPEADGEALCFADDIANFT
jgi:hypothetical protein